MAKSSSHSASDPTAQLVEKLTAALAFQKNSNMEEAEKIYKDKPYFWIMTKNLQQQTLTFEHDQKKY